ncbi:MAG TPA: hypothetical protein VHG29_11770 [Novosphingobium sp.]|nr:hypothetical protein [Novosphingobium sp.]
MSLLFAAGTRPRADDLERLAATQLGDGISFTISHRPEPGAGWLELLAQGLTFDCTGLIPADPAPMPPAEQFYGIDPALAEQELGVIALGPGPHLAAGARLVPLVRTIVGLGARLTALPGITAICWHPARSWIEPAYFARTVGEWLRGGAFPALGLTALKRSADGTLSSTGLGFLIGQEIELTVPGDASSADAARLAVRIIHDLVAGGPLTVPDRLTGPAGEVLDAVPGRDLSVLRIAWRR